MASSYLMQPVTVAINILLVTGGEINIATSILLCIQVKQVAPI
jgi:hypothetical protein